MSQVKDLKTVKRLITDVVKEDNARDQEYNNIHNVIAKVLKRNEGQLITKRIATAVQKELPEYKVYYSTNYGMYHLEIRKGDDWENKQTYLLGYHGNPTVTSEQFEDRDCCHGEPAVKRIAQNEEVLKNGQISEIAKTYIKYEAAKAKFDEAQGNSFYKPSYHGIQKVLGYNQRRR